jgi:protein TonB
VNDPNGFVTRQAMIGETGLWIVAVLVAATLHLGLAAWMLRAEPMVIGDNNPPAAIMIEIADAPQAIHTETDEITPDQQTAEESVAQVEQKQEKPPEEKPVEKPPEPDVPEPVEEEIVEEKPAPVEKVEVPLPVVQPKREKPKPRNQQAAKQSRAAIQAAAQVQQSDRTAALQTTSGLSSLSPANWQSQLMAHLERRKRYPSGARSRGERGTVYVRFTIDGSGNVLSASLARTSGFAELDQEVLALVRRASPVPAPPPGANRTITAPVRFSTR